MIESGTAQAKDAGFTLVETIVAFAVLSLALTVAVKSISTNLHHGQRARVQDEMRQIARTVLAEHSGAGETMGSVGTYTWILHTQPLADETAPGLSSVTLDIRHTVPPVLETRYLTFR
ncbi:MAG: type II secretion system protein [bacterium]|nr:type II secretion system protein [bacterium]